MKFLFVLIVLLSAEFCYSQNDTIVFNTPAVFSITFYEEHKKALAKFNKYISYDDIYIDMVEQGYLSFRQKSPYKDHPDAITTKRRIALKDIKSLGYSTDSKETFGAVLGAGIGFAAGTLIGILSKIADDKQLDPKFSPGTISSIAHPILAFGGTGALLGYIIGGTTNSYENYDLKKFDNDDEGKINEIKKIVTKGLNYKRKK